MSGAATMTTVSAVHEHVHERTQKQGQPDQGAQNVSPVLGEQKGSGDDEKAEQYYPCSRSQKAALRSTLMVRVIMKRHAVLPFSAGDPRL